MQFFIKRYEKNIYENIIEVFEEVWDGTNIRNLGVRLSNLTTVRKKQMSLFEEEIKNTDDLDFVVDDIKNKSENCTIKIWLEDE